MFVKESEIKVKIEEMLKKPYHKNDIDYILYQLLEITDDIYVEQTLERVESMTSISKQKLRNALDKLEIKKAQSKNKNFETSSIEDAEKIYEQIVDDNGMHFVYLDGNIVKTTDSVVTLIGTYMPIQAAPDLIKRGVIKLPQKAEEFTSVKELIDEIEKHIRTYCDVSDSFIKVSAYYVLFSWIYDKFRNPLFYLRVLGDTGTGKSRYLDVTGGICYKPIKLSGAITPAPIYRMIEKWHGTFILDEADRRQSDTTDEVVKILNCGIDPFTPVIRCNAKDPDELQFFNTYCPKVISTRLRFYDTALESRCITEIMQPTDKNIPPTLPKEFFGEQKTLRNKLLMFRLKSWNLRDSKPQKINEIDLGDIDPRLRQVMVTFASLFEHDDEAFSDLKKFVEEKNKALIEERSQSLEGMIVSTIIENDNEIKSGLTPSELSNRIVWLHDIKPPDVRVFGRHLKSLGIEVKNQTRAGQTKNYIQYNKELFVKLTKKYIPL